MFSNNEPKKGRSVRPHLRRNRQWWDGYERMKTEEKDGKAQTYFATDDKVNSVGDCFECAYAYLWITDQPRALAIMIVRIWRNLKSLDP